LDRLKNPSTPVDDLKETLAVLGNAGLEQSESRIVQLLSDGDAAIRADAALALRFLTSNSSELALISTLFSDEDGEVRLRVIDALIHRPVSEAGMAAVRQLISSPRSVPLELKEKALDLFLHAELSADQKQFNSEWIKQRIAIEAESSVKNKLITLLHMMSNSVAH
jgi:HEAT repeat protein